MKKYLIFLIICCAMFMNVDASSCKAEIKAKLIEEASIISYNYVQGIKIVELDQSDIDPNDPYYNPDGVLEFNVFDLNISNISDDLYVEVTNNKNSDSFSVSSSEFVDGTFTFVHDDLKDVVTYVFTVYASTSNGCAGEKISVFYITVPKYNAYSSLSACDGYEEKDFCQEFTTIDDLSEAKVYESISKISVDEDDEVFSSVDYIKNNYVKILIWGISFGVVVVGYIVFYKQRRSDLNEK